MNERSNLAGATLILKALSSLSLFVAFLSSIGCATTALSTGSTGGHVKVFELSQRIPRNSKILGILDESGFTGEWGSCRYRPIIRVLKREAKARGGDAVAILHVQKPFIWESCFKIKAFLLDVIDISDWLRVGLTEEEIRRNLDVGGQILDDIEGIWASHARSEVVMDAAALRVAEVWESSQNMGDPGDAHVRRVPRAVIQAMAQLSPEEQNSYLVAIFKATDDPTYPYAAYILDPDIPEWKPGFLKARLRKLPDSTGYEAKWYGSTFQADTREFHPDETGALTTKVVIEQGLKYSIEQTLTKVYPPRRP